MMIGPDVEHADPFSCPAIAPAEISDGRDIAVALLMVGGVADRATVCRTQRRVRERAAEMAERRHSASRGIGLAILGFSLLLLVLTPVIWCGFHLLRQAGWGGFADFDMQSMYVIGWLFPVTILGLILGCRRAPAGRGIQRIDHRIGSRLESMVR